MYIDSGPPTVNRHGDDRPVKVQAKLLLILVKKLKYLQKLAQKICRPRRLILSIMEIPVYPSV